ncbi:MAG: IclR family transcriptional regulator [Anaerolineae bacterium]|jgi:DNA-binding IclR family transcriptional regulator|nr:IclR family transcriptional regulator [Anaerolineae bacterium]
MTDYRIAVVEDTILVLEAFLPADSALSLAEITEQTGLVKNKVFRILATLQAHGFVMRNDQGSYTLGLRMVEFGEHVQRRDALIQAAAPVMDWLVEETRETIFLGTIDGLETLVLAARESPQSVRLFGTVGRRVPIHTGGVPKVLLAHLPQAERDAILDRISLDPITPYTYTDRAKLEAFLDQIRAQGYVVTADDLDVGAASIAAPIRDYSGRVVAGMSIAGPLSRMPEPTTRLYTDLILKASARVSRTLGYRAPSQSSASSS